MANSGIRPEGVATWGASWRVAAAAEALTLILADDPRVRSAYQPWRMRHGIDAFLPRLASPNLEPSDVLAFGEALCASQEHDLRALATVCHTIGLRYDWVPGMLLRQFRAWGYAEGRNKGEHIAIRADVPDAARSRLAPGRRRSAETVYRAVERFYRTEIKEPQESIRGIANRELVGPRRKGDGRSNIQKDIALAKQLLEQLVIVPPLDTLPH